MEVGVLGRRPQQGNVPLGKDLVQIHPHVGQANDVMRAIV